jgi:hypothetical protein
MCERQEEEPVFAMTPRGYLGAILMDKHDLTMSECDEVWDAFVKSCVARKQHEFPEADIAVVVLDTKGGKVVGLKVKIQQG